MSQPATAVPATSRPARFGVFEFELQSGELRKNGTKLKVEGQPLAILALLLERPGEVVTREELKQRLWPADTFVDFEHSINTAVKRLREVLDDSATSPRFIETLPRRGYRFIYPLNGAAAAAPPLRRRWTRLLWIGVPAALLVIAAMVTIPGLRDRLLGRSETGTIKRIAVLPLQELSGDPEQRYLATGFTEMLITELGRFPGLEVVSHQSVLQYAHTDKPLPDIARELLGVDAFVEGTVLRSGDRVRITINFVLVHPERHLLAESYERDLRDVFAVQGEVARAVAKEVRPQIPAEQLRRSVSQFVAPEIAEAYLRGLTSFRKGTDSDRSKAAEWFQKAIAADPKFALGYAYLALLHSHGGAARQGGGGLQNRILAREWAEKALQLDETLAEAHTALAWVEVSDWNWQGGEREFRRAIDLNPNFTTARTWYAQYLAAMGRAEEAAAQAEVVLQLDPVSPNNVSHAAWALKAVGRVDDAIRHLRAVMNVDPTYLWAHQFLAEAYLQKDMYDEAIVELQSAATLSQPNIQPLGLLAYAYAKSGQRGKAGTIARDLDVRARQALANGQWIPANVMVPAYLAVDDKDKAFAYLEKAYERHGSGLVFLNLEESYRPLRADSRFQDLVRRVGLPTARVAGNNASGREFGRESAAQR